MLSPGAVDSPIFGLPECHPFGFGRRLAMTSAAFLGSLKLLTESKRPHALMPKCEGEIEIIRIFQATNSLGHVQWLLFRSNELSKLS